MTGGLTLALLPELYVIFRFPPETRLQPEPELSNFFSVTRTSEELSVVAVEGTPLNSRRESRGWRILKVKGPLDFSLTGIMASIVGPLARAEISIFAISTFDTDYILIRQENLSDTLDTLRAAGHVIQ